MDFYQLSVSEKIAVLEKKIIKTSLMTLVSILGLSLVFFAKYTPAPETLHSLLSNPILVNILFIFSIVNIFFAFWGRLRLSRRRTELVNKLI